MLHQNEHFLSFLIDAVLSSQFSTFNLSLLRTAGTELETPVYLGPPPGSAIRGRNSQMVQPSSGGPSERSLADRSWRWGGVFTN